MKSRQPRTAAGVADLPLSPRRPRAGVKLAARQSRCLSAIDVIDVPTDLFILCGIAARIPHANRPGGLRRQTINAPTFPVPPARPSEATEGNI